MKLITSLLLILSFSAKLDANEIKFNELAIPKLNKGHFNTKGERVFKLNVREGEVSFFEDAKTKTRGINADVLGPTLYAKKGDKVRIEVHNSLKESTTMHWHGMHLPASMDGGPYQEIKPGKTWVSSYPIKQLATTLWYHPHLMGKTGEQVYQGLAGMFILEDSVSKGADLPKKYAYDDIPVIIQDRRFTEDRQLQYVESGHDIMRGMLGDRILVNATMKAKLNAPAKLVRLRVLNASNARIYDLGFSDEREFFQVGTDGGLLEKPVKLKGLRLAPGERSELIVDLSKDLNKSVDLVSFTRDREGNRSSYRIMKIDVNKKLQSNKVGQIPTHITKIDWFDAEKANEHRSFHLTMGRDGFRINNLSMDMKRIDHKIPLGNKEIWTITTNRMVHPFHVHDVQFQILSRGGKEPYVWENGWKDTVLIYPGEEVKVMMQFLDYADEKYPYMYHCHILEHEDEGMMGQFTVVP